MYIHAQSTLFWLTKKVVTSNDGRMDTYKSTKYVLILAGVVVSDELISFWPQAILRMVQGYMHCVVTRTLPKESKVIK